jgi:hypothetical protein
VRSAEWSIDVSEIPHANPVPIIEPQQYSRDVLVAVDSNERNSRLRLLEAIVNPTLQSASDLAEFQRRLYRVIERLEFLGHWLGRWEYDSEIEIWGSRSYMDPTLEDELLLRSEFPRGVRLAWKNYEELLRSDLH